MSKKQLSIIYLTTKVFPKSNIKINENNIIMHIEITRVITFKVVMKPNIFFNKSFNLLYLLNKKLGKIKLKEL